MKMVNRFFVLMLIMVYLFFAHSVMQGKVLFYDDFDDGKIDNKYEFKNHEGKWVEKGGVISQTDPAPGDHTYLVMAGDFEEPHTGLVKIRVDEWGDGDLARCGLGFRLDPDDASGYAFLIHHFLNNMEFLNDHLAWKQNDTPPPFDEIETGEWYWMKAEISEKEFTGKIWPDGEKEPKKWLLESKLDFGALRPASGQVGLNGGSSRGAPAKTIVSFDNWAICGKASECDPDVILAVEATGKLSTTWSKIKTSY